MDNIIEPIILASQSPRRQELMKLLNRPFAICVSDIEETIDKHLTPENAIEELAAQKARAVFGTHPNKIVIGSDTVVTIDGIFLGKPRDEEDAARLLTLLSGRTHQVITGVCICTPEAEIRFHDKTDVTFYPLTNKEIRDYIATGEPMDKAGAYGAQGKGAILIREIRGDFYSVMGFPIARVKREIDKLFH